MEEGKFLPEALDILSGIKSPMFGVPGNHDYWSRVPFDEIIKCFAATGGAWLVDEQQAIAGGKINLIGMAHIGPRHPLPPVVHGMKNIVLMHYPAWAKSFTGRKFDLMLAGHSHGGQVRIPFYGPMMIPFGVDEYDLGLFQTQAGPLNVSSGIGWYPIPVRFNCRPDVGQNHSRCRYRACGLYAALGRCSEIEENSHGVRLAVFVDAQLRCGNPSSGRVGFPRPVERCLATLARLFSVGAVREWYFAGHIWAGNTAVFCG